MGSSLGNIADNRFLVAWGHNDEATESDTSVPVPAGTAMKLILAMSDPLDGVESVTVVVRRNGVNTAIGCTITAPQTSCSDLVDSQAFVDGDLLSIRYDESGGVGEAVKFTLIYRIQ
jgi:hypothetical protein